jgi:hypothetical protein
VAPGRLAAVSGREPLSRSLGPLPWGNEATPRGNEAMSRGNEAMPRNNEAMPQCVRSQLRIGCQTRVWALVPMKRSAWP